MHCVSMTVTDAFVLDRNLYLKFLSNYRSDREPRYAQQNIR